MRSSKYGLGLAITAACMGLGTSAASADQYNTRFEQPKFTAGAVNGKDGWLQTNPAFDNAINANSAAQTALGLGAQSLRTSNAVTSGSFADQLYSADLGDEAGESTSVANGASGGVRQDEFDAEFTFAAFDPTTNPTGAPAPGVSVALDNGQGARMSQVRVNDLGVGGPRGRPLDRHGQRAGRHGRLQHHDGGHGSGPQPGTYGEGRGRLRRG